MKPTTSRRTFLSVAALSGLAGCGNVPHQHTTTVGPGETAATTKPSTVYKETNGAASKLFVTDSSVWAFWCDFQGSAVIRRHDADGAHADFPIDDVAGTDLTAQFARTTDGAIWASLNYSLTRIADGRASTQHFDREVPGQLPDAKDESAVLPGTWISGLADAGTNVLMCRLHVPFLQIVTANGEVKRGPDLPLAFTGAQAMHRVDGRVYLAPSWLTPGGKVGVLEGQTVTETDIAQASEFDGDWALSALGATSVRLGKTADLPVPMDPLAAHFRQASDGRMAWWDQANNQVITPSGVVQLDQREAVNSRPTIPGATPADDGRGDVTLVNETVSDLRFDATGALWILRNEGRRLDRLPT